MPSRLLPACALLALPLAVLAAPPNLEPGQWQFTSTTSMRGDMQVPDQTETYRECIAQSDLEGGAFDFIEQEEGCELLEHDLTAEGVDYRMVCLEGGGEAHIEGRMAFLGERSEGEVDIRLEASQGEMHMQTVIEGERIGDC